jgi:hypothetical protein
MSDNPLEMTPERQLLVAQKAEELRAAAGGVGPLQAYLEQADELVRMEMAGATGQVPIDAPEFVDEAALEDNLGEFPGGVKADQGERRQTPMTREALEQQGDEST